MELLLPFTLTLAVGLVLAATSVSISAQTLVELGVLRSRVGMALLGDLSLPNSGFLFVVPVSRALGLRK